MENQKGYSQMQFVPPGQTVEHPMDILTVEDFARWTAPTTPFLMMHQLKTHIQGQCGARTFWNILQQRSSVILYEWKTSNCRNKQPDQHAITKILYGPSDVWVVTYSGRLRDLPAETRDWWISWFTYGIEIVVQ